MDTTDPILLYAVCERCFSRSRRQVDVFSNLHTTHQEKLIFHSKVFPRLRVQIKINCIIAVWAVHDINRRVELYINYGSEYCFQNLRAQ